MTERKFPICSGSHYSSYSWHQQSYGNLPFPPSQALLWYSVNFFFSCQIHRSGTWEHFDQGEMD